MRIYDRQSVTSMKEKKRKVRNHLSVEANGKNVK